MRTGNVPDGHGTVEASALNRAQRESPAEPRVLGCALERQLELLVRSFVSDDQGVFADAKDQEERPIDHGFVGVLQPISRVPTKHS